MSKKKWLYVLGIIILTIPVLLFYNAFNGNPLTKYLATKHLEKYLNTTYPAEEFNVKDGFYDFKMGGYTYDVIIIGEAEQTNYEFTVTGVLGNEVFQDGIYQANQDEPLINRLTNQANLELMNVLKEHVPEMKEVDVQLEVLKGRYDRDTDWDKDFQPEKPMYVHIMIDAEGFTQEDVLDRAKQIQTILNKGHYNYDAVTINANIFSDTESKEPSSVWYVKYSVHFSQESQIKIKDVEEFEK